MGSAEAPASTGGTFRPVGFEQPAIPERRVRTDQDIDFQNLNQEEREVVEAEEFIVFGKANIEQWNDPGPGEDHLYIEMDALEEKIDQLLAIDNISFGHQDVRVGEPLAEHTLDSSATVHLNADESLAFNAGDTIRTEVIREGEPLPDGSGEAKEDALWLAANIFGRDDPRSSRFSQKVRLGAYYGDLDGFSVTIDKLEMTPTDQGVRTHEVDFLAVTIGDDEMIKNPGSSFGVAEFQALFGSRDTASQAVEGQQVQAETLRPQIMGSIMRSLLGSSKDALASEAIQQAYDDEGIELQEAVERVAGDEAATVLEQAESKLDDLESGVQDIVQEQDDDMDYDADEVEDAAANLADTLGMDKEFIMEMIREYHQMEEDMDDEDYEDQADDGDEEDDEDDVTVEVESRIEDLESELSSLKDRLPDGDLATAEEVQSAIQESLEGVASSEELEEQLSNLGESISSDIGEFVEEQMETGATPGPTGGGVSLQDLESQAEEWADELTPGAGGD
jgi:hypothetical protein